LGEALSAQTFEKQDNSDDNCDDSKYNIHKVTAFLKLVNYNDS
jgi:hypothetical protein